MIKTKNEPFLVVFFNHVIQFHKEVTVDYTALFEKRGSNW